MDNRLQLIAELQRGRVSAATFSRVQLAVQMAGLELSKRWDIERCHRSPVNTLNVDPVEGRYLLSAGASGHIYIHDTHDLEPNGVPGGGGGGGTAKVACFIDKRNAHCHEYSVESVQWYPLDTGLFSSSGMDRSFKLWDTNRLKPVFSQLLDRRVYRHHVSPLNGQTVLIATENPFAQILDLRTGSKIHQLAGAHRGALLAAAWSPSCETVCVTAGSDGRCALWDVRYSRGHLGTLDAYSDGREISAGRRGGGGGGEGGGGGKAGGGGRGGIDRAMRASHRRAHDGRVVALEFTPDGNELVTFGDDNTLRLWDVALAKNRRINFGRVNCYALKGVRLAIAMDSSPPVVAVPSEHVVKLFDLTSGLRLAELTGHFKSVNAVEYCPFSKRLFSGGSDRNILLWTPPDDDVVVDDRRPQRSPVVGGVVSHHAEEDGGDAEAASRRRRPAVTEDNWSTDEDGDDDNNNAGAHR